MSAVLRFSALLKEMSRHSGTLISRLLVMDPKVQEKVETLTPEEALKFYDILSRDYANSIDRNAHLPGRIDRAGYKTKKLKTEGV